MQKLQIYNISGIVLSLYLLTATNLQAGFEPIIEPAGQAQWRPGPGMPEATRVCDGIKFPCSFNAQATRFYWDCPVSVDLAKSATIELELSCPDSEAVQSVGLYLQSGKGWYLWIKPILKSGRQKFFLQVKDVATEGRPGGWNKITGVRVSFQNHTAANTSILLRGLKAGTSGIIIVNGTSSAPNDGEQGVARKAATRISKWLENIGVAHSVLDDEDVTGGRIKSAKIIILPYNPQISDKEMLQLEKLSAGGSKLIVFYRSNPRLAELLDMQLGKYQVAGKPGQWSGFQFNRSAPPGMPPKIIQDSGNIYTVFPKSDKSEALSPDSAAGRSNLAKPSDLSADLSGEALAKTEAIRAKGEAPNAQRPGAKEGRIIAYWQDASGQTQSDPAWVLSEQGAWMTHILLGEDSENKKKMLLALLGHFDKSIRPVTVQNTFDQTPVINGAANKFPKGHEFRGVWNHSGLGLYPGDWPKTTRLLAQSGITAVFPNMLWAGAAHFPSKYVSQIDKSKPFGDQMAQCVKAARAENLEIHVWKVCWNLSMASNEFKESARKQGRLQKNNRNETQNWLCPSDPANIALELNTILEVLSRYDVDGVHLDYIRYPDDDSCYCSGCRERFEKWSGQAIANWPVDVISGKQKTGYKTWRIAQITSFVRAVRREIKKIKPQAKLSAAVYPRYPDCAESIGQDWGLWLKEGAVDFVCPMDYLPTVSSFRETVGRQFALQNSNKRIYPGIGATLSEGDLGSEIFIGQLRALRERQAGGFMLFDLNPSLAANFLPLMGE